MATRRRPPRPAPDPRRSMMRLEGILASAMDAIITINDRQEIIVFNPAAERMFGTLAPAVLGKPIDILIPERHRAAHAGNIRRFMATGDTDRQMGSLGAVSGLRANGEEFPIEASISQVQVGDEQLATVILRDITERRRAEATIEEARRRMEAIVQSAMDALITIDERHTILVFNPAAEKMFGIRADDAIGTPIDRFLPERFRAVHAEHIRRFTQVGATNRRMGALGAVSARRDNGEEFPVEASISHVEVEGARLATVILRDIAERRAGEEARDLLAREVDHRAKNALAVVQAVVTLTRAETKAEFVEAVRGRIAALGRAHSVLAQSHWQGGDLGQIVGDETAGYGREGQVTMSGPAVALKPAAVQPLGLLMHELSTNAVKYGALSTQHGRVAIDWALDAAGALQLEWREHDGPPASPPAAGGFGSTLIREVVTRQLGGALDVEWPASGLHLTAKIPASGYRHDLTPAVSSSRILEAAKAPAPVRRGRLILVEDEALIAMAIAHDLQQLGWDIVGTAATLDEAFRLVDAARPDVAVLDINLGGEAVYPLAERLRHRQVPFVFCSGYEHLEANSDFDHFPRVRKPVDVQLLDRELLRARQAA